jgi:hypothetical protein
VSWRARDDDGAREYHPDADVATFRRVDRLPDRNRHAYPTGRCAFNRLAPAGGGQREVSPARSWGARGVDAALADVSKLAPTESIAAVLIAVLVVQGSGVRRRARWCVQLGQTAGLQESQSRLLADAAHAVRQVATSEADA